MVICILLGVNIYILIAFQQYKKNTAIQLNSLLEGTDDLMSYHTNLQVLKTFIPNKGTPLIDNEYLDLISKQLFCRIK